MTRTPIFISDGRGVGVLRALLIAAIFSIPFWAYVGWKVWHGLVNLLDKVMP